MIRFRIITYIVLSLGLCTFTSCEEDIVAETLITGMVYNSDTGEGYEGISISYRTTLIGGSSLPELLTYTDEHGGYEAHLSIDEERLYKLVFKDTLSVGIPCLYFDGEINREVNRAKGYQRMDVDISASPLRCK